MVAAARYVELNPVNAGMATKAEDYPWPSASAHLSGRTDRLVNVKPLSDLTPDWRGLLASECGKAGIESDMQLHERTGRPLGDNSFPDRLEDLTEKVRRKEKSRDQSRNWTDRRPTGGKPE